MNNNTTNKIRLMNRILSGYEVFTIEEITVDIKLTKEKFNKSENALYIPKIGKSDAYSNISDTTMKHQNYIQLLLDNKIVLVEYLEAYFNSLEGKFALQGIMTGFIPTISVGRIKALQVPVPKTLEEQLEIGSVFIKMKNLKHSVDNLRLSYLENPMEIKNISKPKIGK